MTLDQAYAQQGSFPLKVLISPIPNIPQMNQTISFTSKRDDGFYEGIRSDGVTIIASGGLLNVEIEE